MKKVLLLVLVLIFTGNSFAQKTVQQKPFDLNDYGVKIEPEKRLIIIMAALQVAGIETNLTDDGKAFSQKLKTDLTATDETLRRKMKNFFDSYKSRREAQSPDRKPTQDELIAPFISMAYVLTPELAEPTRTAELPADLLEVLDFSPLIREFYRKSGMEARMPEYAKLYQDEGAKMKLPVSQMVADLLFYLNTRPTTTTIERVKVEVPDAKNPKKKVQGIKTIEHERRFFVVPDLLGTKGTVNFRNIRDDYYAIVPPGTNFSISETRRAFLQFVIDPLVTKNAREIFPLKDKIRDLLDERRKVNPDITPDFVLAVIRSLVAAVDAKEIEFQKVQSATDTARRKIDTVAQTADAKKAVAAQLAKDKQDFADESAVELSEAYERGAVLSFYFADQLKGLENSGFNIDGAIREMITTMDAGKEKNRLTEYAAARKRGLAVRDERRKSASSVNAQNQRSAEKLKQMRTGLDAVETLIRSKEFGDADARLKKLLVDFPGESIIYYTLGRVSSLSAASTSAGGAGTFDEGLRDKRLEDAKLHYSNALSSATEDTEPILIQLCYYNIGRIHEFYDEKNDALEFYRKAAARGNLGGDAYLASMAGIARLAPPKKP